MSSMKRTARGLMGSAVLGGCLAVPAALHATTVEHVNAKLNVQLISDQHTAVEGGYVSVHILYHNVSNKKMDKAWLKLKLSGKLEVDGAVAAGALWDAAAGALKWQLNDVASGAAGVVHVNLKVKSGVTVGEQLELVCEGDDDAGGSVVTKPVPVKIGTGLHQPAFNGYPDGGFHPGGELTRAETAAIVSRLEGLEEAPGGASVYSDVTASHWAADDVGKVTKAGWMTGGGDGRFRPDAPITRGEFAVLLLRMRGIEAVPLPGFDDDADNLNGDGNGNGGNGKHWAKDAIGTGKALGYLAGDAKGWFKANSAIRRDEAAKLLALALARGELTDGQTKVLQHWPDVPRSAWSFGWVEELSLVAHESRDVGFRKEELIRYAPELTQRF
ncbi:S-layer homology domain-containing protein [Paenibacillus chartarius]|uniref:S-layer homology domain-containing protein n=1 Tax=Paenibacillus chartarius TaxID=747481 RepID=A0ABV6DV38_9BACL